MRRIVLILALALAVAFANEDPSEKFTESEQDIVAKSKETMEFQAEVHRLMDIIIHSLYSNRDIFLRELISNAADASDKVRFLTLSAGKNVDDLGELDIKVKIDKEARTLTITDKGIGMTRDELIKHLGVVAKSGTTDFLEKATQGGDALSLIGQFGVGFYSVYLVADKVVVASKSDNDDQYIWESNADKTFSIARDPRGNTLQRGTQISVHFKEDADEFLDAATLERLITKYSSFINYPIKLWSEKFIDVEEPIEESEAETAEKGEDDVEVTEEDDVEGKPKTRTVQQKVNEWKVLNTAKAIWTRNPKDITEKEYEEFYQTLTKDTQGYISKIHFTAEGEITFRSILYIPTQADQGLYDKYYEKSTALKLHVRRVLISDTFEDLLPKYMNFVKGVVDSDDLPLNVSRETLAQSKVLRVMGKKLTRKVLEMLRKLADGTKEEGEEETQEEKPEGEEDNAEAEKDRETQYKKFWDAYSKSVKLGVIDDKSNKNKLVKLLRFHTTKSEFSSLDQYVQRMKEEQKYIYYITGESLETVKSSPFLEKMKKRDLEVILLVDPLDEYLVQVMNDFDGKDLMSVTKTDLKFGDEESVKARVERLTKEFQPLTEFLSGVYGNKVEKIVVSTRLTNSPCVIVTGQFGWSANMERLMKAQTFGDKGKQSYMVARKTLEINPYHPAIKELNAKVSVNKDDSALKDLASLLYDAALVNSGFGVDNAAEFATRINRVISLGLAVDPDAAVEEEQDIAEEPQAEAESEQAEQQEADTVIDGNIIHEDL